jgi:hypothetical protein
MERARTGWGLGILAIALWAAPAFAQQQPSNRIAKRGPETKQSRTRRQSRNTAGTPQVSSPAVSSGRAAATANSVPQSGTPSLENPRPTGTLGTLPNQTLTPGATTVPSNAGGIAPASNAASSGEYTPSEGYTAPATPGGNPSETQGVPTFSSGAQPASANLPRTVNPTGQAHQQTTPPRHKARRPRPSKNAKSGPQ